MFTIIIPFYNGHQHINKLLSSIPDGIPIIIVDDKSDNPLNNAAIRLEEKGYFTGAVNRGIEACNTDILILNQDTYFENDNWLNYINEQKQHCDLFGERAGNHPAWPNRYVHGTFMYIKREVIDKIGLMDTDNYPLWGSTCEYQLRACRAGFKASPDKDIPGFVHKRTGNFGSSIQQVLSKTAEKYKLIRTPPMVSVVITCYNYGRYLEDAINSLIGGQTSLGKTNGQTLQSFEIIIIDDGSTDNSAEIAEKLADPWKGIHFVAQQNAGSAAAMNKGIVSSHARSDSLIAVLDADDMMRPDRLQRMVSLYEQNPHSVIYDNITYFSNGQIGVVTDWQRPDKKRETLNLGRYDFERMLYKNGMHKGLLYPKRAWEEAGGYPNLMNKGREDWAFNIALGIKGWCGINTGEYDYLYRREGQNRTLTNTTPKWRSFFLGQIRETFPEIYNGDRPDMCCGRGVKNNNNGSKAKMAVKNEMVGRDGWVILEYIGGNAGNETWYGDYGTYVIGGAKPRSYVDQRDKKKLLNLRDRGKPVFKEYVEPVKEVVEPVKKVQPQLPDWETVEETTVATLPDLSRSISTIESHLEDLGQVQLEELLKLEKDGKNRSTLISKIEKQLELV